METQFRGVGLRSEDVTAVLESWDDEEFRGTHNENWLDNPVHRYALVVGNRLFPPKLVLSRVAGLRVDEFTGGEVTNRVFRDLGFEIRELEPLRRAGDAGLALAPPFDSVFDSWDEAWWAFEFLRGALLELGIRGPDDPRFALTMRKTLGPRASGNLYPIHLNVGNWRVMGFRGRAGLPANRERVCLPSVDPAPASIEGALTEYAFSIGDRQSLYSIGVPMQVARSLPAILGAAFRQALEYVRRKSESWSSATTRTRGLHVEELARAVFDERQRTELLRHGLKDQPQFGTPFPEQAVWWVNQGGTLQEARAAGILWAPDGDEGGQSSGDGKELTKLQPGDIVLHYADGHIMASSEVLEAAIPGPWPFDREGDPACGDGHLVKTQYADLPKPIPLRKIPEAWRKEEGPTGPFTMDGQVTDGYTFPVSPSLASRLYVRFPHVFGRHAFKIPPGRGAEYWQECLHGGYACVGWDDVGNLRAYASKHEFRSAFEAAYSEQYNDHASAVTRKSNELWHLMEIEPGDVIVANNGVAEVLAIGVAMPPGYTWSETREVFKHTVPVSWEPSYRRAVERQGRWGTTTVLELAPDDYDSLWEEPTVRSAWWVLQDDSIALPAVNGGTEDGHFYAGEHATKVTVDDNVVLWRPGSAPAIVGVATVEGLDGAGAVRYLVDDAVEPPLARAEIDAQPSLAELDFPPPAHHVSGTAPGQVAELPPEQWQALLTYLERRSQEPQTRPTEQLSLTAIHDRVSALGLRISERDLRRYHLALASSKFVILSGISGTGKTWLTRAYAQAIHAKYLLTAVAPNWTTNEDLLGYHNPFTDTYVDTEFSRFLRDSAEEFSLRQSDARPYHLVLDEMNLARVEYYFATFLSAMEVRSREGSALLHLGQEEVRLPPNLYFVGTVNVDETTHGFADKIYDRAQLIELSAPRSALFEHLDGKAYQDALMDVWDAVSSVAPFAFRVLDEVARYVAKADSVGVHWREAVDEQILQKVLPKLRGTDPRLGTALAALADTLDTHGFSFSKAKLQAMLTTYERHGISSFF